ncbi:MAG: hypothetical protein AAF004_04695 [Pseudomonadota bacterium]
MSSGRNTLAEIDRALATSRDEFRALDIELQSASANMARQSRREIAIYQQLARERLASIDAQTFVSAADKADKRAGKLLDQRAAALEALNGQISASEARAEALRTAHDAALAQLDDAEATLNALLATVDETLSSDETYIALTAQVQLALDTASNAAEKTAEAEARRERKRKPYDADPLFSYLWAEHYGTSDYEGGLLQRFGDSFVARHIRFESARRNYFTLIEIPKRLGQHAARLEATAAERAAKLADYEQQADDTAGAAPLRERCSDANVAVEKAAQAVADEQQTNTDLMRQREQFALGQDTHFTQAMSVLSEQFRAEPIPQLRQEAAMTPTATDDALVDELAELRDTTARLTHYLSDHRDIHSRRADRVNELSALRRRFKDRHYDASNSLIDDQGKVHVMLGEFMRGVISSERLWRTIRHAQRFKRSRMNHHRRQRVGSVRIPRMPRSVRIPRSGGFGGGSRSGGGFRTKGGF